MLGHKAGHVLGLARRPIQRANPFSTLLQWLALTLVTLMLITLT